MNLSNQLEVKFSRWDKTMGLSTCVQFKLWTRRTPKINYRSRLMKISPHQHRSIKTELHGGESVFPPHQERYPADCTTNESKVFNESLRNWWWKMEFCINYKKKDGSEPWFVCTVWYLNENLCVWQENIYTESHACIEWMCYTCFVNQSLTLLRLGFSKILEACHKDPTSGYIGTKKTLSHMWPGVADDTNHLVSNWSTLSLPFSISRDYPRLLKGG